MIRINLLPHREEKKASHRRRFQMLGILMVIVSVAICALVWMTLSGMISNQQSRNQYLKDTNAKLDQEIKTIDSLKKQKAELLGRKKLVEGLQKSRGDAVKMFDQMIRATPDGIYLTKVEQAGNQVTLQGYGLSNARVSDYMRSLAQSQVFTNPALVETQATVTDNQRVNSFILKVDTQAPPEAVPGTGTDAPHK